MGALGVALCALTARAGDGKRVTFDTQDGVTLEGTFFAASPVAPATAKDATVLILHNIDKAKGGSSHQDKWDALADTLSNQGYSVLSFDFRGLGNSHSVHPDFWDKLKNPHNALYVKGANKNPLPDSIKFEDFKDNSAYYPYLVNDISAAKTWLDQASDSGRANSSNLVVIGAGEGATLGAMWMASQMHLKKVSQIDQRTGLPTLDEPEGRDVVGAVWLSISPKFGSSEASTAVKKWAVDMAVDNKVRMAFVYGAKEEGADSFAQQAVKAIDNKAQQEKKDVSGFTNTKALEDSKLSGSELLNDDTLRDTWIPKYVNKILDERGPKNARKHDVKMDTFVWTFPGTVAIPAKQSGEDNIHIVPVKAFLRISGD